VPTNSASDAVDGVVTIHPRTGTRADTFLPPTGTLPTHGSVILTGNAEAQVITGGLAAHEIVGGAPDTKSLPSSVPGQLRGKRTGMSASIALARTATTSSTQTTLGLDAVASAFARLSRGLSVTTNTQRHVGRIESQMAGSPTIAPRYQGIGPGRQHFRRR
jgi:hypothetical protein